MDRDDASSDSFPRGKNIVPLYLCFFASRGHPSQAMSNFAVWRAERVLIGTFRLALTSARRHNACVQELSIAKEYADE